MGVWGGGVVVFREKTINHKTTIIGGGGGGVHAFFHTKLGDGFTRSKHPEFTPPPPPTIVGWITGHHVYKDIWKPVVGETLICEMEPDNTKDQYAEKITSSGRVVGHVPRVLSKY